MALPSRELIEAKFDLSIALALSTWQALTIAVQSQWGGPDSSEKRDWLAGAISDFFASESEPVDGEYLEEFMLQAIADNFGAHIEDGTGEPIAELIVKLRRDTLQGNFAEVDHMYEVWQRKQSQGNGERVKIDVAEEDQDTDAEVDGDDEEDDHAMEIDPTPRQARPRVVPEIDEDGFTKVVGRRGR